MNNFDIASLIDQECLDDFVNNRVKDEYISNVEGYIEAKFKEGILDRVDSIVIDFLNKNLNENIFNSIVERLRKELKKEIEIFISDLKNIKLRLDFLSSLSKLSDGVNKEKSAF